MSYTPALRADHKERNVGRESISRRTTAAGDEPRPYGVFLGRAAGAAAVAIALLACACAPLSVTRIGPALPPRTGDCAVEILEPGEIPQRPYRDVGMVTIESCQDYRTPPCRLWLEEAVCGLGGQVAYVSDAHRPDAGFSPMRAQVLAAVYVSDLRPEPGDPLLRSRTCDPACAAGSECVDGECAPAGAAGKPCDEESPKPAAALPAEGPQKCLE